jgi:F0F1-type ATP synthase assembly protein I
MRAALSWQFVVTAIAASVAIVLGGIHASISAALGGGVVLLANAGYAFTVGFGAPRTAGATLRFMLRAEAVKVTLFALSLWLVFTSYREVVPVALIGTLIVTVLVWPVALLYRD